MTNTILTPEQIDEIAGGKVDYFDRHVFARAIESATLAALVQRAGVEAVACYVAHRLTPAGTKEFYGYADKPLPESMPLYPPEAIAQLQARIEALSAEVEPPLVAQEQEPSDVRGLEEISYEDAARWVRCYAPHCVVEALREELNKDLSKDNAAQLAAQGEAVAEVRLLERGGNVGIATRIAVFQDAYGCDIDLPVGTKLYAHLAPAAPVVDSIVAGALYDFMGWLTSRRTRLVLSDKDLAGPAADAIVDFSKMRGLSLDGANVLDWQAALHPTQPKGEKA